LYGVFASSEAPIELPLVERLDGNAAYAAFEKTAAPKRQALRKFLDEQYTLLLETARQRVGDYLVHVATTPPDPLETAIFFFSLAPTDLRPQIVARWRRLLEQRARPDDPIFGAWHELMSLPDLDFSAKADVVRATWRDRPAGIERGQFNPLVRAALEKAKLTSRADVARAYGDLLREVYEVSKKGHPIVEPARRQLLDLVVGTDSPG